MSSVLLFSRKNGFRDIRTHLYPNRQLQLTDIFNRSTKPPLCEIVCDADDDIHSLLIMCRFCVDTWEAGRVSLTDLSELTGMKGQMDAITCFCFLFARIEMRVGQRGSLDLIWVQSLKLCKQSDAF